MPRCSNCGKLNRDGALFCQDCGSRIEAAPAKPAPAAAAPSVAAPAASGNTVCTSCGTANPPGMNFCKMCGNSLVGPAAAVTPVPPGKLTCASCGKQTPAGFAFCQHCGQRLHTQQVPAHAPMASAATMVGPTPTPPAGVRQVAAASSRPQFSAEDAMAATVAPSQSAEMAAEVQAAQAQARAVSAAKAPKPEARPEVTQEARTDARTEAKTEARPAEVREKLPSAIEPTMPAEAAAVFGRLISVNRDGSDGKTVPLAGMSFDIGRTEGNLVFGDDPYLAARHARLQPDKKGVTLRSLDTVNGVYLRVQGSVDLAPGDQLLVGKELLRFEPLAAEERDPPSLVEHGVRLFGSTPRESWGRLRQLTVAGTTRDVWHMVRPELVLGREEGDVTFPDDEFMSRRHAALRRTGAKVRLEDLQSSNGTFVRVRAEAVLKPGDVIRMGDQLMRFEP